MDPQPRDAESQMRSGRVTPRRVVYIASLGHSGSTLLDLVLGAHSSVVGLGEVGRTVAHDGENPADGRTPVCSCGHLADECRFWSTVLPRLGALPDASYGRRYEVVLDRFGETFGPDAILVDSSKYLGRLAVLKDLEGVDLRVIFLVRDVRSFAISEIDNAVRKRGAGRDYRGIGPFAAFRRWHTENLRTARFLADHGLPFLTLGYEELCLAPERMVPRICEFLAIPSEPSMVAPARSASHVLRGNRMRLESRRRGISYDPRWLVRREWMLPALLCRQIMRFNREQVYSNGIVDEWAR